MSFGGKPSPNDDTILKPLFHEWIECNEIFNETLSAIVTKEGQFCGIFLVRRYVDKSNSKVPQFLELGHFYKPKYHGSGIATIIGNKMINNCFNNKNVKAIIGKIKSDNFGSQAIAIRCGFRFHDIYEENNTQINIYKLTKEKYSNAPTNTKDIGKTISEYIAYSMQHAISCKSQVALKLLI